MTRFTFLEAAGRSPLDRLRDIEIDARIRKALGILSATIGMLVFVEGVEQARLSQAHAIERARIARLQSDERRMIDVRSASDAVSRLSALAAIVRDARNSGDREAAELTEIAASLPAHLWLTSIRQEPSGLTIQGEARSYALIGDAMQRFAHARTAFAPVLLSSGVRDNLHPDEVEYEIRLQERAR